MRSSLKRHGAVVAPFGFALLTFAAIPSSVAYQDLASLIASRAAGGDRGGEQAKSPFGTFHAATFSFPRPVGTAIPEPVGYRVASLDLDADLLTGSTAGRALFDLTARPPALDRETVNRSRKGDRVVPRAVAEWLAREQATRAAAAPLTAPEAPAVVAVLPDAVEAAPPAPKARTGWPLALPQTEKPAAEVTAKIDEPAASPAPRIAAPQVEAPQLAAPQVAAVTLPAEAFSASSMAWLGATPEPTVRQARSRRAPKIDVATPAESHKAAEKAVAQIAPEAAPEPVPQQGIMLASAGSEIVLPRAVTPQADLQGPPDPAADPLAEAHADTPATAPLAVAPHSDTEPFHPDTAVPTLGEALSPSLMTASVYFGAAPLADVGDALQPWSPEAVSLAPDQDELAALDEITPSPETLRAAIDPDGGETIARKGEVMPGDGRALRSPAERLNLFGHERAKAEKCLADAVYFESRGEPVRGQIAVAQVVMNRVFSGYYPADVCGVVYQNAHRHLSCQFTFACDGIKDKITEPDAWARAQQVATETLDGKHWLPDVGKATHYHAYWVRPWWVRTMHKLDKIGVHTFYRPRAWGDGADRPAWGDASLPPPAEKISDRL
ncbi:cell wall hydrolase [Rhodoplanes roseus]|nr:cell wall hydrolase [Rhodoplanes roseus]